jgi:aspartokinase
LTQVNPELLLEVARLARKYPTGDWRNLLAVLKDDSSLKTLVELAETMSQPRTSKRLSILSGDTHPTTRQAPVTTLLRKIGTENQEKAEVLKKFRTLAVSRQLFESTSDLRDFAISLGLKVSNNEDRERVTNDLIRMMSGMETSELTEKLSSFTVIKSNLSQDYERWVKIILGKQK